jgi:hypothetical protein
MVVRAAEEMKRRGESQGKIVIMVTSSPFQEGI